MPLIELRFPAGRFHATPWGRHVNEGAVEWPPSPWRILRALIATWYLKVSPEEAPEPLMRKLIQALAQQPATCQLPPGITSVVSTSSTSPRHARTNPTNSRRRDPGGAANAITAPRRSCGEGAGIATSTRSENENVDPAPAWLRTLIVPPISPTRLRQIARPRPVPP